MGESICWKKEHENEKRERGEGVEVWGSNQKKNHGFACNNGEGFQAEPVPGRHGLIPETTARYPNSIRCNRPRHFDLKPACLDSAFNSEHFDVGFVKIRPNLAPFCPLFS